MDRTGDYPVLGSRPVFVVFVNPLLSTPTTQISGKADRIPLPIRPATPPLCPQYFHNEGLLAVCLWAQVPLRCLLPDTAFVTWSLWIFIFPRGLSVMRDVRLTNPDWVS